jgi:hypothetical protein
MHFMIDYFWIHYVKLYFKCIWLYITLLPIIRQHITNYNLERGFSNCFEPRPTIDQWLCLATPEVIIKDRLKQKKYYILIVYWNKDRPTWSFMALHETEFSTVIHIYTSRWICIGRSSWPGMFECFRALPDITQIERILPTLQWLKRKTYSCFGWSDDFSERLAYMAVSGLYLICNMTVKLTLLDAKIYYI